MKAGITHSILGEFRPAIADFERGNKIRPDDVSIIVNYAWTAIALGDKQLLTVMRERSLPFLDREMNLHPNDITYAAMVVWALAATGSKEEARAKSNLILHPPDDQFSTAVSVGALFACDMIDEAFEVALAASGVVTLVRYAAALPLAAEIRNDPRYQLLEERMQREMEELAER